MNTTVVDNNDVTLSIIAKSVSDYFNVPEAYMFTRSRKEHFIKFRSYYVGLAKHYNRTSEGVLFTNAAIGFYCFHAHRIKQYDHANILHASKVHDNFMQTDMVYKKNFLGILRIAENLRLDKTFLFEERKNALIEMITAATSEAELNLILS
jgi:purine-nucleoside phosphorylase